MNNHKPLGKKKTVQLLVILTLLAWATQTLVHQWGFGDETDTPALSADIPADAPAPDPVAPEKFVNGSSDGIVPTATLEMCPEATIVGTEVKLKQICRWNSTDAPVLAPIADLTVLRLNGSMPFHAITIDEIRQTLHDAGVNLATINFVGAASCTVTRSDLQTDQQEALRSWIDSHSQGGAGSDSSASAESSPQGDASSAGAAPAAAVVLPSTPVAPPDDTPPAPKPFHTLRDLLTADACQRLSISPDAIQMTFSPQDEKVLDLSDVCFKFDIEATRLRNLGRVAWDVTIFSGSESKKVQIEARAQAWEDQVVVATPLAQKEVLRESDFITRHVLVDELPDEAPLTLAQCAGQEAAEDLKPGEIMAGRMVDPVPLIRTGQLVTITLVDGSVQIRGVARAMETGVLGETIKVRSQTSRDVFDVVVTGEQEARLGPQPADAGSVSLGN
jgi:flagella basal body P-ring formation protein FlgA